MEPPKIPSTHGGARPGAGRPKKVEIPPPPELLEALRTAKSARALDNAAARVASALAEGKLTTGVADGVLAVLKERRQLIKARREEKAKRQVRALEILTPAEVKLLADYRAKLAGPPMQPGESAAPPETE